MPPTQSVNVITSPLFYSSSLESGSQAHHRGAGADNDHDSWASALSSKALSRFSAAEGGWTNVTLESLDETTWQEEAHWMSFHHAVLSLVVSCRNKERARPHTGASHCSNNSLQRVVRHSTDSPDGTCRSSDVTGDCFSLVHHSTARQAISESNVAPVGATIHITVEEAHEKTRLALAQAEQDEWEITNAPCRKN